MHHLSVKFSVTTLLHEKYFYCELKVTATAPCSPKAWLQEIRRTNDGQVGWAETSG